MPADRTDGSTHPVGENISTILRWEEEAERDRTRLDRAADRIADLAGRLEFIAAQIAAIILWIALNIGHDAPRRFDPYPFPLLCLIVTTEAVLLAVFVLVRQNRMSRRAEERNHLALQINLLTERETTKLLQAVDLISRQLGIEIEDPARDQLRQETEIEEVADIVRTHVSGLTPEP